MTSSPSSSKNPNHNDNDDDIGDDDNTTTLWYFAIGAMMNPTSINLRGIRPLESRPAELLDHDLYWFGALGNAEAIEAPGKSFHGVLHRINSADMEKLDVIEVGYNRRTGHAKLYDNCAEDDESKSESESESKSNNIVKVTVYTRHDAERGPHMDSIPRQRYLEIMISGAEHYGVDPHYIQNVLKEQEYQPRTLPDQFKSLGSNNNNNNDDNDLPFMTRDDIRTNYHGKDPQTPFCFTVNGKVVQWIGKPEDRDVWTNTMKDSGEMMLSRILYDPKYGLPERLEDFTKEHCANCEHEFYVFFASRGLLDSWRVIGRVQQTYKDDEEEVKEQL